MSITKKGRSISGRTNATARNTRSMVSSAQRPIQAKPEHMRGHTLRSRSGSSARHGGAGAHGARHELRGSRWIDSIQTSRRFKHQTVRVSGTIPSKKSSQVQKWSLFNHVTLTNSLTHSLSFLSLLYSSIKLARLSIYWFFIIL